MESKGLVYNTDFLMHAIDYGMDFDETKVIKDGDTVYMADFSLQPYTRMQELNRRCDLTLYDHHKSAFESVKDIKGFHETDDISGCRIVWEQEIMGVTPKIIHLLSDYDCWKKNSPNWDTEIIPFQWGMRSFVTDPGTPKGWKTWNELGYNDEKIQGIIDRGNIILSYQNIKNANDGYRAFEIDFEGYRTLCINGDKGSQQFNSIFNPDRHDIMLTFQNVSNLYWTVSIYTTKDIDVATIAHKRGGGGHRSAAGFQVKDITTVIGRIK